jgi:site-specific recombinase XerD
MAKLESAAAFQDYIAELDLRQDLSPSYLSASKQRLHALQAWLEGRPISANAAKQFLAEMRDREYQQKTIKAYYAVIKPFLEYLRIPFKVRFHYQKRLPTYHPSQHIDSLLAAAGRRTDTWAHLKKERDKLIILTFAYTGLRRAELAALTPCDIVNDYIHVRSGKGDKDRVIPLAQDLREPLLSYIHTQGINPTATIFQVGPKHIYTIIRNYARAAGFDMSPHALRHYFATALLEKGAPLSAIQQLLGHATIATTAVYLDMVPTHLRSAMSLLTGTLTSKTPREEEQHEARQDSELYPLLVRPEPHRHHRSPGPLKTIRPPDPHGPLHNETDRRIPPKRGPHIPSILRPPHGDQQRPHATRPDPPEGPHHNRHPTRTPSHLLSQSARPLVTGSIRQNWREPLAQNGETPRQIWRESLEH